MKQQKFSHTLSAIAFFVLCLAGSICALSLNAQESSDRKEGLSSDEIAELQSSLGKMEQILKEKQMMNTIQEYLERKMLNLVKKMQKLATILML